MLSRPLQIVLAITLVLVGYSWWKSHDEEQPQLQTRARSGRLAPASVPAAEEIASEAAEAATGTASGVASSASRTARSVVSKTKSASDASEVSLFPKQTWAPTPPPPPPPAKPTPTPVPVAPPLPFNIVATWHTKGVDEIVLEAGGQQYVVCTRCEALGRVQQGETLLGVYRVEQVTRQQIVFTFMPLNQQQVLPIGGTP
ncbi:hypothetical protein [Andreprevotia chitinilytica]|uniref:hypothetical protein n=1 Tax=Andreprevotia chitinilytica TaxID=396808 RepID=UPI00069014E3|nr:hypothetical protein [Andreprevotia chitinilytica]